MTQEHTRTWPVNHRSVCSHSLEAPVQNPGVRGIGPPGAPARIHPRSRSVWGHRHPRPVEPPPELCLRLRPASSVSLLPRFSVSVHRPLQRHPPSTSRTSPGLGTSAETLLPSGARPSFRGAWVSAHGRCRVPPSEGKALMLGGPARGPCWGQGLGGLWLQTRPAPPPTGWTLGSCPLAAEGDSRVTLRAVGRVEDGGPVAGSHSVLVPPTSPSSVVKPWLASPGGALSAQDMCF